MNSLVKLVPGVYHDSVSLMRVSQALMTTPGVEVAVVAMATPLNLDLARELGFDLPSAAPSGSELLVALRARDVAAATGELDRLLGELSSRSPARASEDFPPRTTRSAARTGEANLVLVSVPGEHAFAEALDAVEAGLPVMIFSDNLPVEQEVLLKRLAEERGGLVMGPDCGTAVIGGAGLGFANVLRPGAVGVVAASGTGAQHVTSLLDAAGVGVSHVLGVGSRDLSAQVGGLSAMRALRWLDDDPGTELIVLVSKPPAPEVARAVQEVVDKLRTPVVQALLGVSGGDLTTAAESALRALGLEPPDWPSWSRPVTRGPVRGLYSGGTLCTEASLITPGGFVDYGDDVFTRGRAHPMIDPTLRLEALAKVEPGEVALMDVVLGHGADPDPALRLAPAIEAATGRGVQVVIALVGTEGDPQGLRRQAAALYEAGAAVFTSNAHAARHAAGSAT
ncbi:FdrA family protein [Nonomuraea sp. NPDC059194]|uniref:FdrA family protein n=1 Tax=Nonomuraea sp. NPDC059194 TaxID=3346764 RepID=UPI0036C46088